MINYMLFDLRDKLEPIGKLDLLDMVARKALDYFKQFSHAKDISPNQ
ncbi:MAG: hypothetical protein HQL63_12235 [Magnetococcales bacterium]|nr:hypothetical protein [Magnetococcales bacterium]MBF0322723.1 hypothetical protein [Magnetococcales bacterium]